MGFAAATHRGIHCGDPGLEVGAFGPYSLVAITEIVPGCPLPGQLPNHPGLLRLARFRALADIYEAQPVGDRKLTLGAAGAARVALLVAHSSRSASYLNRATARLESFQPCDRFRSKFPKFAKNAFYIDFVLQVDVEIGFGLGSVFE